MPSRRLGCGLALGVLCLNPGVALLAADGWVRGHGGGWAVLGGGAAATALGLFVLAALGAVLRQSAGATPLPEHPPEV